MKKLSEQKLYRTPFSREYWRDAAAQLFDVRILCIAAIFIAIRVALKPFQIDIAPTLSVQIGFFINALSAAIIGPVVASIGAFVSDTLGVFVAGDPWIPIFAIVEISGSLTFSLMLWRSKFSASRIIISRFLVVLVCNIILNPILLYFFYNAGGKGYSYFLISASIKNAALYPLESILLVLFFGLLVPVMIKAKVVPGTQTKPEIHKKHIVLIAVLLIASILCVGAYCAFYLPTQSVSASQTVGDYKLTLKSNQRAYKLANVDPTAPLSLTATLKNNGETDVTASHGYEWCDIILVAEDGTEIPIPDVPAIDSTTDIAAGKSVKYTDTFAWEWSEMGSLPKGKYTAVAEVNMNVDGEAVSIKVKLPIKLK